MPTVKLRIYADFNGFDKSEAGRDILILDGKGTRDDLEKLKLQLSDGLEAIFYDNDLNDAGQPDDIEVVGIVRQHSHHGWVAEVDWTKIRHSSDQVQ